MTVAVGFFDGVHLGHQAILKGADIALTFDNHPLSFLHPESAPRLIMTRAQRIKAIESLGICVKSLVFDSTLGGQSPSEFLNLLQNLRGQSLNSGGQSPNCGGQSLRSCGGQSLQNCEGQSPNSGGQSPNSGGQSLRSCGGLSLRCGANWRFGKGGAGDADWLRERGVDVVTVPYSEYRGERISSTRIRQAIESGALEDAAAMMGRPFSICGEVFVGKGEGRKLGFPTVNIRPQGLSLRLPMGVYVAKAGGCKALANYGVAPTMGERSWREPVLELHFLAELPATAAAFADVEILSFIRPECKFASAADLKSQIAEDMKRCS